MMLHLANAESTAGPLRETSVPGIIESADEILMAGPARNGLIHQSDWEFRAQHLECYAWRWNRQQERVAAIT